MRVTPRSTPRELVRAMPLEATSQPAYTPLVSSSQQLGEGSQEEPHVAGREDSGDEATPSMSVQDIFRRRMQLQRVVSQLQPNAVGSSEKAREEGEEVIHTINGVDQTGVEHDIPEDSYGAAILAIVKEVQEVCEGYGGALSIVRCIFALVLLVVNLLLQACILLFISSNVVQPAVHHIQENYRKYHAEVFDAMGTFQRDLWDQYDGKDELCQIGMTSRFFYCVLLFVWVTSMLGEFRAGTQLVSQVFQMPTCDLGQQMLRIDGSSTISIVALTRRTRAMLFVFVCLPKLAISMFLLVLGCKWLSATTSFEALVMNTMAMEFVLHIDELLYEAFLPVGYRRQVADINFFVQELPREAQTLDRLEWVSYGKAIFYLVAGAALVILWSNYLQTVLPLDITDVKEHCQAYLKSLTPICPGWSIWSLEMRERSCYPYGGAAAAVRLGGPGQGSGNAAGHAGPGVGGDSTFAS